MIIKYKCPKCSTVRTFTRIKKDAKCNDCDVLLERVLTNISVDSFTTEESRFINDEAIYNTMGKRANDDRFGDGEEDGGTQ